MAYVCLLMAFTQLSLRVFAAATDCNLAFRAMKKAAAIERGRADFERQLEVFKDPKRYLDPAQKHLDTTPAEDRALIRAALRILVASGKNTANANHISDHLKAVEAIAEDLKRAGIDPLRLVRNILLHDLGKEYHLLPADYRAFLEDVFPKPESGRDANFLPRVIMSHEFGSMLLVEKIAKEAGIPPEKVDRLKALFAHHNAGYDPKLSGFHFWVQPFAWGAFAKAMKAKGIDVPEIYAPVLRAVEGGAGETTALTALDRAVSWTLASQEKFAPVLVSTNRWNNGALAGQFGSNAKGVLQEVRNVMARLKSMNKEEQANNLALAQSIERAFKEDISRLNELASVLPQMAAGTGPYTDRPPTTQAELESSIVYRTKQNRWFRVANDGKVYEGSAQGWVLRSNLSPPAGATPDVPGLLFRKFIFPDYGYEPTPLERVPFLN